MPPDEIEPDPHELTIPELEPESPDDPDGIVRDLEELQDRHLRLAAEFENYRKRTRRELAETRVRAQADLVGRLLESLDDLGRVAHAEADATAETMREGIGLVERKLQKALGEAGVTKIEAAGRPFDPTLHEALTTCAVDDPALDDTVGRVLSDGYTLRDVLVRPARVEVYKYSPKSGAAAAQAPDDRI